LFTKKYKGFATHLYTCAIPSNEHAGNSNNSGRDLQFALEKQGPIFNAGRTCGQAKATGKPWPSKQTALGLLEEGWLSGHFHHYDNVMCWAGKHSTSKATPV
jgi:hypothetical protein